MKKIRKQKLPRGWTQKRLRELAECYDNQSEDEHTAEHEAALKAKGHTVMVVPTELVPQIVQLISQKEPA